MSDSKHQGSSDRERRGRRQFFLLGVSAAMSALSDFVQQATPALILNIRDVLRPPGAITEKEFLRTCYRCGSCVDACPEHAISSAQSTDEAQAGTPLIDADLRACSLCSDLPCTKACPSGALVRIPRDKVRIGLAHLSRERCQRHIGQDCRLCLDKCPVSGAIRIGPTGQIDILRDRCVGCGACQQVCPVRPKAICVEPL